MLLSPVDGGVYTASSSILLHVIINSFLAQYADVIFSLQSFAVIC